MQFLQNLNQEQKEAVFHTQGPLLILAGAGTGKTKVLTSRLAYIVSCQKALPSQILAVTFTNKAAAEMKERSEHLLGVPLSGLGIGTFHSIASRILRKHADIMGYSSHFTIIDSDDQVRLMRQILSSQYMDDRKENAKKFLGYIETWKDHALLPGDASLRNYLPEKEKTAPYLYELYQAKLKSLDAVDFSDLLLQTLHLFQTRVEILERLQNHYQYIMIDEYQDTNILQYLWIKMLSSSHRNLCCVGDDDQSIYGWRGAEIENILKFEKDFQDARVIKLEQNYRSTAHILGAASCVIARNKGRLGKTLWTEKEGGEKVFIKALYDGAEEARWIAEEIIQRGHSQRFSLKDVAILVRAGFQTRVFEECFMTLGIPCLILGGFRFYDRQEIKDALAYLRLALSARDSLAFERIVNVPKRSIGDATLSKMHRLSREKNIGLVDAAQALLEAGDIKGKGALNLRCLLDNLKQWQEKALHVEPHDLLQNILEESGYLAMWQQDNQADSLSRIENLKELVVALKEFSDLRTFIEHVSLVMENSRAVGDDAVHIMTMHSSKGLEFDYVFLPGWEEGIFPSQSPSAFDKSLEEERRLAYVGLTRAKKVAYISFAMHRLYYGQWNSNPPSRFIKELPEDHIFWLPSSFGSLKKDLVEEVMLASPSQEKKRVFHIKFGYGTITKKEGDRLYINFDHSGPKTILASFVKMVD